MTEYVGVEVLADSALVEEHAPRTAALAISEIVRPKRET
jgi:hypothetical protein